MSEKMDNTEAKLKDTKKTIKDFIWLIGIIVVIIVTLRACVGCGVNEKVKQEEKSPEELQEVVDKWWREIQERNRQDSASLVNYIKERLNEESRKLITIGFEEFNNVDQCLLQIGIPDNGWEGQDEVGKFMCKLVVEWFVENKRDLEDVEIGALVYSPRKGVSGRESWRIWGFAMYRYITDDIKWYNSDEIQELLPNMVHSYED